jgi:predicted RND superfamily exporter protein
MRVAVGHRGAVFVVTLAVLAIFAVGIGRIQVETDATRWFPPGSEVRDSYEAIRVELSGISPVNVVLEAKAGGSATTPAMVRALDGLAAYLEAMPDVGKAVSIGDPLRQIHGGFLGDPELPLPDQREMIEQYLMLLESVEQIDDLVTPGRDAANVVLRVDNNGSGPLLRIARQAEDWWAANGVPSFRPRATGIMYEFARAEDEIALGQLRGLALALAAIAVILLLALRRVPLALMALAPNVAPILIVFGFMGLAGVPLDAGTVIVGSLALGMAVDDTVHLISAFREATDRRLGGVEALDEALARVAHPMVLTTAAVGIGFGLLGFSQFTFTRNLGLLIAGTMVVCLLADLILLPALLRGLSEGPHSPSSRTRN